MKFYERRCDSNKRRGKKERGGKGASNDDRIRSKADRSVAQLDTAWWLHEHGESHRPIKTKLFHPIISLDFGT